MNIEKKDRTQLKNYFRSNAAPTEQNFKDFIDANLNQKEDGIAKIPDGPIAVQSASASEELLHFYKDFKDVNPAWTLSQKSGTKSGFSIASGGSSKLFIDASNGNIGVNLQTAPLAKLHLYEETGSAATPNSGSLLLEHGDTGGQSSIVFKSKSGAGTDYGYLSFIDNIPGGSGKISLLTLGSVGDTSDHIALMPGGSVGIGTKTPAGKLHIYEATGTKASALAGSILLEHGDVGGQSSIVFKSKNNAGSDFAYIAFQDDAIAGGTGEASILTISAQNDAGDHIALMPSGNVGIGRNQPKTTLDVRVGSVIGTAEAPADESATTNRGSKVRFGGMVNQFVGMDILVKEGTKGAGNSSDIAFSTWETNTSGSREVMRLNGTGNLGLGTATPAGKLHLFETVGTQPSANAGTLLLEHGDAGGQSSIVFKSKNNAGSDYAYIAFQDDAALGGPGEANVLTISTQNETNDHISLLPSGNVGIGLKNPQSKLHILTSGAVPGVNGLMVANDFTTAGQDAIITAKVKGAAAGNPYISMVIDGVMGWSMGVDNADEDAFKISSHWVNLNGDTKLKIRSNGNVGIGTPNLPDGRLHIYEAKGTKPSGSAGSLLLEHGDTGGQSSIVFKSKNNLGNDYAFIAYQDDASLGGAGESSVLTIGNQNEPQDHIALMPSGNIGFGRTQPKTFLDVKSGAVIGTGDSKSGQHEEDNRGSKVRFGALVDEFVGMDIVLAKGTNNCGNTADITFNTWECNTSPTREVMRINGSGCVGIGTQNPKAPLHVVGSRFTAKLNGDGSKSTYGGWDSSWSSNVEASLSIFAELGIGTRDCFYSHNKMSMSDTRIKEVIGRSNAQEDLARLRQIQVTDYRHIDKNMYGSSIHKKVIAQQVEAVYPEAVGQRRETIPNIYAQSLSTVYDENSKEVVIELPSMPDLEVGDKVDLIQADGTRDLFTVEAVTGNCFTVSASADLLNVFVYGKQVDDFRFVDYDSLFMLGVSAIQALSTEMDTLKQQLKDLQNSFATKAIAVN